MSATGSIISSTNLRGTYRWILIPTCMVCGVDAATFTDMHGWGGDDVVKERRLPFRDTLCVTCEAWYYRILDEI